ncbi:MAG: hypothetical protein U9P14_10475, partial [Gemmatimonadota bacterium]|nr:hypothetical protein [Gemmatimonadota bacterium]
TPAAVRDIIHLCKSLAPQVKIFVRARHHIFRWELFMAGAETVIDEEAQVGRRLAEEVLNQIGSTATGIDKDTGEPDLKPPGT